MSIEVLPLIRLPESWPVPVAAGTAMVTLAALDLVGAYAAKEWQTHRSAGTLALGVGAFLVLFWVYASALQYGDLALVTIGWIVVLQVGLLVVDRVLYDVHLPMGKWLAITLILVAQAYLLLPASTRSGAP